MKYKSVFINIMEHRHISHRGQQNNKAHSKSTKQAGKVENRSVGRSVAGQVEMGKEQRYNQLVQQRKNKREELVMKRRGLNFITEHHEQNLDMQSIETLEKEIDNIAPKIIGILSLSAACDTKYLRDQMVDYCVNYMEEMQNSGRKNKMEDELKFDRSSPFQAYVCPNAGSSNNSTSRKQRLIFLEIDRNDVYSVLDIGKIADLVVVVMSSKEADTSGLKTNPDDYAKAIDE